MVKAGITGGIGSGKSTICKIFEMLGIPVFYADEEAKQLYNSSIQLKALIKSRFGDSLYRDDVFDKKRMSEIVFNDPEKLKILNLLIHPMVKDLSDTWMKKQAAPYVLKEAALLIESGSYKDLDELIFVDCPIDIRLKRVKQRDNLSQAEILNRMNAQMPEEEKKKYAAHIILNDDVHMIIPQVMALHEYFLQKSLLQNKSRQRFGP